MKRKYAILLCVILLTGCGEGSNYDMNKDYVFDSAPQRASPVEISVDNTIYVNPRVSSGVPSSVGDSEGYSNELHGIYLDTLDNTEHLTNYASTTVSTPSMTAEDREIIRLQENEAWEYVTEGTFTEYPRQPFYEIENSIRAVADDCTEIITVDVWYWENPSDPLDMRKTTKTVNYKVNTKVANLFRHIFADIYNDSSQPIINIGDSASGTWVIRGKLHNSASTLSAHSIGTCIDLNPSTGSYNIGGVWYGNGYGQNVMTKEMWEKLPESHTKHHVIYDESPIVQVFKSYGFYWGGDWSSTKDNMHFAYLGDGGGRAIGYRNYVERGGY